jgi:YVTN family beta-propeller protein
MPAKTSGARSARQKEPDQRVREDRCLSNTPTRVHRNLTIDRVLRRLSVSYGYQHRRGEPPHSRRATEMKSISIVLRPFFLASWLSAASVSAMAQEALPDGQSVTPTAAPGAVFTSLNPGLADYPKFIAGQAVTSVVGPDGRTLLVLTSGYNRSYDANGKIISRDSNEYVFVFDITSGSPVQKQVIQVPNSYSGVAFSPDGAHFYVSGGKDDSVHTYAMKGGNWAEVGTPIALGHGRGNGLPQGSDTILPAAAGLAATADGKTIVVANYENDSISLVSTVTGAKTADLDLRPGKNDPRQAGVPGGEFPYWVAVKGNDIAYVSSVRDREVVVIKLQPTHPAIVDRIGVTGNPNRLVLDKAQTRLYVALDNSDAVAVIDTTRNRLIDTVKTAAPLGLLRSMRPGASPDSLTFSPDGRTLYVTNGGTNSVAVLSVLADGDLRVVGLIPTGWYPSSVSVSADGKILYVVNSKSNTGPNPAHCRSIAPSDHNYAPGCPPAHQNGSDNQYTLQLAKAGLLTLPVPMPSELDDLTRQVAKNNGFNLKLTPQDQALLRTLRKNIKHVIYIVKENRTYDQILGDLPAGNGDPNLTQFPQAVTPNQHALAKQFVQLDNFYDPSNVSYEGWQWSTAARSVDATEKTYSVNYAKRGLSYDSEGTDRNINVAYRSVAARQAANPVTPSDPDLLPGPRNEEDIDGPGKGREHASSRAQQKEDGDDSFRGEGEGYLWDAAIRARLAVRNYGFHCDLVRYSLAPSAGGIPPIEDPYATRTQVAFPAHEALLNRTDPYFRSFDDKLPDFFRYIEWAREFDDFVHNRTLPDLTLLRLMNDHTGAFARAIRGVNTPELQVADNDYAVGLVVDKVAHSPYAGSTMIFVVEDDAQDGPDHVDAHRSIAFVAGPYVKQGQLVSERYTTVSLIRTIEEILGVSPQNLHDAGARPMIEIFEPTKKNWTYRAAPSPLLLGTRLPFELVQSNARHAGADAPRPLHDAEWWAERTKGFDFTDADRNDPAVYNRVLWQGTMSGKSYPTDRSGLDMRHDRDALLKSAGVIRQSITSPTP